MCDTYVRAERNRKTRKRMMNALTDTIPANGEKACSCCGRFHRKLVLSAIGTWVGASCAKDIKNYLWCSDPKSILWVGYEKQHAKVAKLFAVKAGA